MHRVCPRAVGRDVCRRSPTTVKVMKMTGSRSTVDLATATAVRVLEVIAELGQGRSCGRTARAAVAVAPQCVGFLEVEFSYREAAAAATDNMQSH